MLFLLTFVIIFSTEGSVDFGLGHFQKKDGIQDLSSFRGELRLVHQREIAASLLGELDARLGMSWDNTQQYRENEEGGETLALEVEKLLLNYTSAFLPLNLCGALGIASPAVETLSSQRISAPMVGIKIGGNHASFESGIFKLSSNQKFLINQGTEKRRSSFYHSALKLKHEFKEQNIIGMAMAYEYFDEIGPDVSFQAGLRNNTTYGNRDVSEMAYDFSIFSMLVEAEININAFSFHPIFNFGFNQGAYRGQRNFFKLELPLNYEKLTFALGALAIEKNALLSLYSPEEIGETNISGQFISLQYAFSKNRQVRIAHYELKGLNSGERSFSTTLNFELRALN